MNEKSKTKNRKPEILIVGAGPAGAGTAIRLAQKGFEVCLIEREKFPRQKLCGEFISPECLAHFRTLGVLDEMLAAGGERISETVFYEPSGKSAVVPSAWFGQNENALSLSRAEMDFRLLEKAKSVGVKVFEESSAVGILNDKDSVIGVKIRSGGKASEIYADLIIDASGRSAVLSPKSKMQNPKSKIQNRLVGFKTHLKNVGIKRGVCEIYFFSDGYGGLSFVENGLANHCFLIRAETVKKFGGDAEKIVREVIFQNRRAAETLKNAEAVRDWLAVSVESFGVKNLNPAPNLIAVGDAGAFIDPFTGSGMLMALESAEILADAVSENEFSNARIAEQYKILHYKKFRKRLLVCSLLRRAAFVPTLAKAAVFTLSCSDRSRKILARSTRKATAQNR